MIKALTLQSPETMRIVPDINKHVNSDILNALVNFHDVIYVIPQKYGTLAHHVMAADILGENTFFEFIASHFRIPVTRLDMSHNSHEIKNIVGDRMRLKVAVPSL